MHRPGKTNYFKGIVLQILLEKNILSSISSHSLNPYFHVLQSFTKLEHISPVHAKSIWHQALEFRKKSNLVMPCHFPSVTETNLKVERNLGIWAKLSTPLFL